MPLAHEMPVHLVLTIENDIVPSNRAHRGQVAWINPLTFEIPKAQDLVNL